MQLKAMRSSISRERPFLIPQHKHCNAIKMPVN